LANPIHELEVSGQSGAVLLVDDSPIVLRWLKRILGQSRYPVTTCASPHEAIALVSTGSYHVVISDISMPEMSGLELLKRVRQFDSDLPVVLLTGVPSIASAAEAVELGAFMYLMKPVAPEILRLTVERAAQSYQVALGRRETFAQLGLDNETRALEQLESVFENTLASLWLAYQPIVRLSDRSVFGYEALLRSDNPDLHEPESVLHAAERLGALDRLGRALRALAARPLRDLPKNITLFVNLHPQDLLDLDLSSEHSTLAAVADRVVLEITERMLLSKIENLSSKISELRRMGFRLAIDDLGAGYSNLANIALLEPEFIKLDMALVRNIDQYPVKQKLVESLIDLGKAMGQSIIAEGIETQAECATLTNLGCDLLQGFLFARPERKFPITVWPPVGDADSTAELDAVGPQSGDRLVAANNVLQ
jgi:EAL domain-containing protein (putative c-di-GMP-specific phosphodiesterase class I)